MIRASRTPSSRGQRAWRSVAAVDPTTKKCSNESVDSSAKMTAMDEATAVWRARELVRKVRPSTVPVQVERYAAEVKAEVRVESDCERGEAGYSFEIGGRRIICVNAADRATRQRFTICHEIAHAVLDLPSQHKGSPGWSYARRPLNEIWCDVFAAELLLPFDLFKPRVIDCEI